MFGRNILGESVALTVKFDSIAGFQVGECDQHVVAGIELEHVEMHRSFELAYCRTSVPAKLLDDCQRLASRQNRWALPPRTASPVSGFCPLRYFFTTRTVRSYEAATRQTGQSEPIMRRSGPNDSKATSRNGTICSGCQCCQSPSVTSPDSLQYRFGNSDNRFIPCAHESM